MDIPAHADYAVAIVPVSDPYFRYSYARRAKLTGLPGQWHGFALLQVTRDRPAATIIADFASRHATRD